MEFEAALGRGIAAERARAGWTQLALAQALHVPRSAVSDMEGGSRRVSAAELVVICRALSTPLSRLLASADQADRDALGI